MVLALASLMLWWLGYGAMDLVVFALTICAIVIVAASLLLVLLAGIIIRRRLGQRDGATQPPRLRAEAGYPNETGFSLPALPWLPLVSLQWQVVSPDATATRNRLSEDGQEIEETIIPRRRCRTQRIIRRFTVTDILGLCRFAWRQSYPGDILVLPRTGPVRSVPMLRSLSSEDGLPDPGGEPEGDRMEIRRYTSGDSIRHIMWGVYARTRQLNVRLPERSVFQSERTLAYMISGEEDEAAAAAARVALESGALGSDWLFGADGSAEAATELSHALTLLADSRALENPHSWGLDDFLQQHGQGSNTHCVLFAPARPGAGWPRSLKQSLGRFGGRCSIVLATDGLLTQYRAGIWRRLLFRPGAQTSENEGIRVNDLQSLLSELGAISESLIVIDRRTGQSFDHRMKRV